MSDRVQVAVRLRPFNDRERARNAQLIIGMNGNTTIINDPNQKTGEKKFTFDFSYWSHDGYREREDGYLEPVEAKYADQAKVFEDLGLGVLENAWNGFNCSLFAYGQTGSGKSYSMVGYNVNKGIIPVTCERLFEEIKEKKSTDDESKEAEYQVSVSMLEIYNETVKDLLNTSSFKKGGLRVREHPSKGFFVEELKVFPVIDYAAIEGRIAEGTRNRTLASTNMNATSSRAHTIVAITFTQKALNDAGQNMTKTSVINLVDLAGSERAESTGATGDRLKEGAMINKSLSCLGNCIKALADQQGGKTINVPFRDSTLTRLLKNALGGNSKTVMIAALSPADINYDETLSTLRFADRAKSIKTKAVVNESPTDKLIREMRGEIERLQELLKAQAAGTVVVQGISEDEVEELRKNQEAELRRNQQEMDEMNQTWEQRLDEQQQKSLKLLEEERAKQEARKTVPNLWNLNEDPMLSGMIVHLTHLGTSKIGNAEPAEIVVKGLGIQKEHAVVENNENSVVSISALGDSKILVNGKEISEKTVLRHNDRIMFGSNQLYVLHHPQDAAIQEKEGKLVEKVSFNSAQEEIAKNKGFDMDRSGKSKDDMILQEELIQIMPMVNEANAMSQELDKKMLYDIALMSPEARGLQEGRTEVFVKAKNLVSGNEYFLDKDDFEDRRYGMQEMYQNYMEEDENWDQERKDGFPFRVEPSEGVLIGTAYLYMQSLAFLLDVDEKISVQNHKGKETGLLSVTAFPYSDTGKLLVDDDIEDSEEIIGKRVQFQIRITKALDIPPRFVKVWCQFKFFLDEEWTISEKVQGSMNFNIDLEKKFKSYPITAEMVKELEESFLMIQVMGEQSSQIQDQSRQSISTRDLMSMEDAVTRYQSEPQHSHKGKSGPGNAQLKRRETEVTNLHNEINKMKNANSQTEMENAQLRQANEANQKQLGDLQNKLELITKMVKEAQNKGEKTLLVARLAYILQHGRDLSLQEIKKLESQAKTSSNPIVASQPEMPPTSAVTSPKPYPPPPPVPASKVPSNTAPYPGGFPRASSGKSSSSSSSSSSASSKKSNKNKKKTSSGVCALL